MEALITLTGVVVVPIVVASLLARYTRWPRFVVALLAGAPLPLILLGVALFDYRSALNTPPDRCGMSCGLDKALSPDIMAVAVGYMAIAVGIAFLTATVVRRRRR